MVRSITFDTVQEAIEHAEHNGGWIFKPDSSDIGIWFAPGYGVSNIITDTSNLGSGFVATCCEMQEYCRRD